MERLFIFDLETTSTVIRNTRIVQVAYASGDDWRTGLVNPGVPIPEGASKIHGLYDADVEKAPGFNLVAKGLTKAMDKKYWAGYNCNRFDIPVIKNEFVRNGVQPPECIGVIDALSVFINKEGRSTKRGARTLMAAHVFYCGCEFDGAHDALADIRATKAVIEAQMIRYGLTIEDMVEITEYYNDDLDSKGMFRFIHGVPTVMFGKYKGLPMQDVAVEYYQWIAGAENFREDVKALANNALRGIFPVKQETI